ncbi:2-isopropylmalate synthase [gamma proteobacterium BDW918]|mgnify:FL=1|uniref:2-isopropylmalate synthase n=1 Tax=Zhongshania aliphaticivorans TaxID=1470434 RepID=A0A127M3U0_9GAMM|nr:2-isopropylmalate synthase [Zhongshania aliphaticivorans]AMO67873.1 2-isopropylmalate synthase [Zhongshania aliphaticivorans]EIF44690.1 2-isopropylmalate synthase [gamma proteobacterium BDW918]|tara:strand:- start:2996 stop:4672 length:1677 start_codon:yes stop_codon:yes gene_type:complete
MADFNHRKYRATPAIVMTDRQWPNNTISQAPQWCSVDLRDGNQALVEPMTVQQKLRMWDLLVKLGFTQIEVGFPAASQPDFDFVRALIDGDRIPDNVTVQVLTQAREELIARSYEALKGAKQAIIHVYNSTSPVQRERVFGLERDGITAIAVQGARWVKEYAARNPETKWSFQYSPESFSSTEVDFAVEISDAVIAEWRDTGAPIIINLPATVECASPNVFADQVEWFCRHTQYRKDITVSVHTHNDRGCGVAAGELAVMAGADRVEGTLLGNGERTGNMDIVTMAMNLYSQGVDPKLNLADMDEIIAVVEHCTTIPLHPRHPYAGELVFTAFSGSHQDAIRKCLGKQSENEPWQVAYLPIDPADLGRSYEAVIRINSQSGKGGVSWVLENDYGLQLPRWLQIDASRAVQAKAEEIAGEVSAKQIWELFDEHYLQTARDTELSHFAISQNNAENHGQDQLSLSFKYQGKEIALQGHGDGAISALVNAWQQEFGDKVEVLDYREHALDTGTASQAVAYVHLSINNQRYIGVAMHRDVVTASLQAVLSAASQAVEQAKAA